MEPRTAPRGVTSYGRAIGIGAALSLVVALIVLAFAWPSVTAEPKDLPVAVGLGARDLLDPTLPTTVLTALRDNGLPADRLVLEIGEHALAIEPEASGEAITRLSQIGIGLALEGFGTGYFALAQLAELPLEALAYVHVAGGFERDGVWHDSHAHPVPRPVLDILTDLASRVDPPGVLLERDEHFPEPAELERELAEIRAAVEKGGGPKAPAAVSRPAPEPAVCDDARERLGLAQAALLSALVAGTPAPEGFDRARLKVQARALAGSESSRRAARAGREARDLHSRGAGAIRRGRGKKQARPDVVAAFAEA